ncbi:MAG TPA: sodium:calcium antiporter [Acidimicrobiia bacterium]|nr:sodium:calcium antiporter [Acidimicrobiia bacterium]
MTSSPALWVLVLVVSAVALVWFGTRLARSADEIAERAGLSRLFVGMILVAGATSLPEIVTDVSASLAGAPDLAVGDLFGSSMANMAILAVVDLLHRRRVWARVEIGHARVASVAIALTAFAVIGILVSPNVRIGWIGIDTLAIAAAYVFAVAWMRRSPDSRFLDGQVLPVPIGWGDRRERGLRPAVTRFSLSAVGILVSAPFLAYSAREIAAATGVGETFVGTTLLALATSLPELIAAVAAVRIGAQDLAVGNLFGSNCFNMAALLFADLAYVPGPLLGAVHPGQAVAGVSAVLLMSLALAAIVHGTETRVARLEPDAILLLLVYLGGLGAVWMVSV